MCRVFFPKRGSNLPGSLALRFDPLFLRHVKGTAPSKTIFVTGSNGKSTTSNMIIWAFETAGRSIAANTEGANMKAGIASALVKNTNMSGRLNKDFMVFEVDERSLAAIASDLPPGHLCLTNIQKDQVQRNGDPDYIYQMIKAVVSDIEGLTLYVNNEDPRGKSMGKHVRKDSRVVSFGVAQNDRGSEVEEFWGITMPCPICCEKLDFSYFNLSCVGAFRCPACGFASDAQADLCISHVDYENEFFQVSGTLIKDEDTHYHLAYPAVYFLYNYSLSACVSFEFGIDSETLSRAFKTFRNVGGRMETFTHAGKNIHYMRIKQETPEPMQSALDTMASDGRDKVLVVGPAVVDDMIPNYSNTFYVFDCNFEPLLRSGVERCICFGSTISYDMANRLRYAGFQDEDIDVLNNDDDDQVLSAIAAVKSDNIYLITWLRKYEELKERANRYAQAKE